jgi:hypothetical protein
MNVTLGALERLRRFAQAMTPTASSVDLALPATRALFEAAGGAFKLVGGIAVVHHGYLRTTQDIDVLVEAGTLARVASLAAGHGFVVETRTRLRHVASGVAVDLLVAGEHVPRPGSAPFPAPGLLEASPDDERVVALAPLLELKLHAHRYQDLADVVALLKPLDDGRYLEIEAAIPPALRRELADLRRDAMEEEALRR